MIGYAYEKINLEAAYFEAEKILFQYPWNKKIDNKASHEKEDWEDKELKNTWTLCIVYNVCMYTTDQKFEFTCCLSHCLNFYKNKLAFFFNNSVNVIKIWHLMILSWRQNVNFIKMNCKKRIISIFLENVNSFRNN